jgi:hypothetical protein
MVCQRKQLTLLKLFLRVYHLFLFLLLWFLLLLGFGLVSVFSAV